MGLSVDFHIKIFTIQNCAVLIWNPVESNCPVKVFIMGHPSSMKTKFPTRFVLYCQQFDIKLLNINEIQLFCYKISLRWTRNAQIDVENRS